MIHCPAIVTVVLEAIAVATEAVRRLRTAHHATSALKERIYLHAFAELAGENMQVANLYGFEIGSVFAESDTSTAYRILELVRVQLNTFDAAKAILHYPVKNLSGHHPMKCADEHSSFWLYPGFENRLIFAE